MTDTVQGGPSPEKQQTDGNLKNPGGTIGVGPPKEDPSFTKGKEEKNDGLPSHAWKQTRG